MTHRSTKPDPDTARAERRIAGLASAYPGTTLEHPWGHSAFKVRGKTFLFLGADAEGLSLSVKLPHSGSAALVLPFTEPTHYGLGKSGWVTASFKVAKSIPLGLVEEWLDESYRAIAPKTLAAELDANRSAAPSARRPPSPERASKSKQARATTPAGKRAAATPAGKRAPARKTAAQRAPATTRAKKAATKPEAATKRAAHRAPKSKARTSAR